MRQFILMSWAWGKSLEKDAAWDSARNVSAVIGCTSMIAYITTMPWYWMPFTVAILSGAWYADYLRHF